jgi:hypothetical protein
MTFQQSDTLARGGEWLMDAARRRPEALLLMAAGCALLMRPGGTRGVDSVARRMSMSGQQRHQPGRGAGGSRSRMGEDVSRVGENLGAAAQSAADYAGDMAGRVGDTSKAYAASAADTVSGYAEAGQRAVSDYAEAGRRAVSEYAEAGQRVVSDYAESARRTTSEFSEHMMEQAQSTYRSAAEVIREQPMLVAALGLAAGAAVAAMFPATEIEKRTFGAASDALSDAAAETGQRVMGAASAAGQKLKEDAAQRGLDAEGLKEMARDAVGTFTEAASKTGGQSSGAQSTGSQPRGSTTKEAGVRSGGPGRSSGRDTPSQAGETDTGAASSNASEPFRSSATTGPMTGERSGNASGKP